MAKIRLNNILKVIRGHIGKLVFRVRPDGTVIISGAPSYKKNRGTPKQKAHWERVSDAAHDAKFLAKMHPIYAQLAAEPDAKGRWLSAYNFAFADCMKPPVIHRIERREGRIRVEATDNIMVTKVHVSVMDESGKPLEAGNATRAEGNWWEYACHTQGTRILAEAFDLPRNCTQLEI